MTEAGLQLQRRERVLVARLSGELDLANAGLIRSELLEAARDVDAVIADLDELTYIDSAGLSLLDDLARRLRDRGIALRAVISDQSLVRRTLAIAGMDALLPIDRDLAQALDAQTTPATDPSPASTS